MLRGGVEGPASVQTGHQGNELGQPSASLQHEGVDGDPGPGAAENLPQGLLDRPSRGGIAELHLPVLKMGRRLAIGDDDDLLVGRRPAVQVAAGEDEAVLEVRPVLVSVPGELGQGLGTDLPGVVGKADDGQVIVGELAADEGVEGEGDLLGGDEAAPQEHRSAHIHQKDGGRPSQLLRPVDLEVVGGEGEPPRLRAGVGPPASGVGHRPDQVGLEGIPPLEGLGRLVSLAAAAQMGHAMAAHGISLKPGEEVVEDLLPDPSAPPRSELQTIAEAGHEPRLLQTTGQVVESLQTLGRPGTEEALERLPVHRREVPRLDRPGQLVLQAVQGVHQGELVKGLLQTQKELAAEPDPGPQTAGEKLVEGRRQLRQVPAEPVVPQEGIDEPLELGLLLGGHGPEEGGNRGHPFRQLLHHVVEGLGPGEEGAKPAEEVGHRPGLWLPPRQSIGQEAVELSDHLPLDGQVLGTEPPQGVRETVEVAVQERASEPVEELLEPLPGRRLQEVVVLECLEPSPDVGRETIQLLQPPAGQLPDEATEMGIPLLPHSTGGRRPSRSRLGGQALKPSSGFPWSPGGVEASLDPLALGGHDRLQLLADIGQDIAQMMGLQDLLAPAAEGLQEVPQAGEGNAIGLGGSPAPLH